MGNVIIEGSVSVDGFIADSDDNVGVLFDWYFNGPQELEVAPHQYRPRGGYRPSPRSAEVLRRTWSQIGATVVGRRLFDLTDGWGGKPPVGEQVFVVTHRDPGDWPQRHPHAPFHFVGGGVTDAIEQARIAAGGHDVSLAAGNLAGQALQLGVVDQIDLHVVPALFGAGVRFFGDQEFPLAMLGEPEIINDERVTHVRYRVRNP